jgi:peroxiredoxin Q/BCP
LHDNDGHLLGPIVPRHQAIKEPSKATKGRRMSKSAKTNSVKPTAVKTTETSDKTSTLASTRPAATKPAAQIAAATLKEGAPAPNFTLPRDGGGELSLKDFAGRKLVLFFYPRADTPGCTLEAVDFTRLSAAFAACGTAVIGVSADPVKAQDKFRDKHRLTVPLLSDETLTMLKTYGVWGEKSMYGKVFEGVLRTTVLIGSDGRIARIWSAVKVDGHADAVLAAARDL